MIEFAVTVQGQRISCTKVKGELVSGAIGARVRFTWSEEWQQLQRIGVFRAGSIARDVMDLQDECVIPWEVLAQPGQVLMIGVQGVNEEGTAVTPTLEAEMDEILRGADPSDDPSTEPSLPIWKWVKNLLEQVVKKFTDHFLKIEKMEDQVDENTQEITELQNQVNENDSEIATLNERVTEIDDILKDGPGKAEAVLYIEQELDASQKAQARENIGAADSAFVGDSAAALDAIIEMQEALLNASGTKPDDYGTPYAVEYIKQELTESAKAQARENIGAITKEYADGCFSPTGNYLSIPNGISDLQNFFPNGPYRLASDPQITANGRRIDVMIHFNVNANSCIQFGFDYTGTKMQHRGCWYGTWYDWVYTPATEG